MKHNASTNKIKKSVERTPLDAKVIIIYDNSLSKRKKVSTRHAIVFVVNTNAHEYIMNNDVRKNRFAPIYLHKKNSHSFEEWLYVFL